jgi:hypothetical protein
LSYGFFSVQGTQSGTPASNQTTLGPFNVPFGGVGGSSTLTLSTGTTTFPVPAGALGVAIIPPIGNPPGGVTLRYKQVSGDTGSYISTEQPTIHEFDTVNSEVPADVYLVVAGGSIQVTVQWL